MHNQEFLKMSGLNLWIEVYALNLNKHRCESNQRKYAVLRNHCDDGGCDQSFINNDSLPMRNQQSLIHLFQKIDTRYATE